MNLKKTLVAAAVAAIAAAPAISHAAATLYGTVAPTLDSVSSKTHGTGASTDKGATTLADNTSVIGIKGSTDLGNGLTGFGELEMNTPVFGGGNSAVKMHQSYMGVKGSFGTAMTGHFHDVFYHFVEGGVDVTNWLSGVNFSYSTRDDGVAYFSPNMSGFTAGAAVANVKAPASASGYQTNNWQLGGKYSFGMGYVGAGYTYFKNPMATTQSVAGIAGGYSFGMFGVDAMYTKTQKAKIGTKADEISTYAIDGTMSMGSLSGYLLYSAQKSAASGAKTGTVTAVGVSYAVSNPLSVGLEYGYYNKHYETYASGALTTGTYKAYSDIALSASYSF